MIGISAAAGAVFGIPGMIGLLVGAAVVGVCVFTAAVIRAEREGKLNPPKPPAPGAEPQMGPKSAVSGIRPGGLQSSFSAAQENIAPAAPSSDAPGIFATLRRKAGF